MILRALVAVATLAAAPVLAQVDNLTLDDNPTLEGNPTAERGPAPRPGVTAPPAGEERETAGVGSAETAPLARPGSLDTSASKLDPGGAIGVRLATLDKIASETQEIVLAPGMPTKVGDIEIVLGECRFPASNPTGEAFAWLEIREKAEEPPIFTGWMVASSPALNALDHARYDVWVIRCTNV